MAKIKSLPNPPRPIVDDDDDEPDCPRCPPVGAPAWMATFADMATLLMAFFVLILSFANFDEVSFKKMTGSLREPFGVKVINIMSDPDTTTLMEMDSLPASDPPATDPKEERAEAGPGAPSNDPEVRELAQALAQALENGEIDVSGDGGLVSLRLPEGTRGEELAQRLAEAAADLTGAAPNAGSSTGADDSAPPGANAGAAQAPTQTPDPGPEADQGEAGASPARRAAIAEARLKVALQELEGQGLVDVQQKNEKVVVTVGAGGAFRSGSSDLTEEARAIMSRIALASAGDGGQITVTGHTDNVPLTGGPFQDNWGLAAARAAAVVRELGTAGGLQAPRLTAVSRGETDPVSDNSTEAGRAANRRIEIELDFSNQPTQP